MNQLTSNTEETAAVLGTDRRAARERAADALYLASNAFLNIEQLLLILRGEAEGSDTIDRKRVDALVQIGIDLAHMQGELVGKEADAAFAEVRHG